MGFLKIKKAKNIIFAVIVTLFGSILFGFHSSVISGAQLFIFEEFNLSHWQIGFLVSNLVLGAIVGSLTGGSLADQFGRKKTLIFSSIIFFLGTYLIVNTASANFVLSYIFIGRFILGIAVGIVSVVVPLYLSEISPIKYRGRIVSLNQLAIVFGVLTGFFVNYIFADKSDWRMMIAVGYIFSFLLFIGMFFISPSKRWLFDREKQKKNSKTKTIILKDWRKLLKSKNALVVGIGISVIQQITGINVIIYYAPKIFKLTGLNNSNAILATTTLGIIKFIMTIVSLYFIDRIGRRKMLLIGVRGMIFATLLLGGSFYFSGTALLSLFSLIIYIAFFAVSLGPITWLLISEIYPNGIRGRAMGLSAFSNWSFNYLISLSFLPVINMLGPSVTFFIFVLIGIASYYFIKKKVPETKNKSFAQIEKFWKK